MVAKFIIVLSIFLIISTIGYAVNPSGDDSSSKHENLVIEIRHCSPSGAESLAKELYEEFGVEAKLVMGRVGSFDVFINGELIFLKDEVGRLTISGEIVQKINEYMKK